MSQLLVYVSGAYTAPNPEQLQANIERARLAGLEVRKAGYVPVVPHLAILYDDPNDFTYEKAMQECLALLRRCDAVLMVDGWRESRGAKIERHVAYRHWIPVCHSMEELRISVPQLPQEGL